MKIKIKNRKSFLKIKIKKFGALKYSLRSYFNVILTINIIKLIRTLELVELIELVNTYRTIQLSRTCVLTFL